MYATCPRCNAPVPPGGLLSPCPKCGRKPTNHAPISFGSGSVWAAPYRSAADCLYLTCTRCGGTGRDSLGRMCVHAMSCPCPKCTPTC